MEEKEYKPNKISKTHIIMSKLREEGKVENGFYNFLLENITEIKEYIATHTDRDCFLHISFPDKREYISVTLNYCPKDMSNLNGYGSHGVNITFDEYKQFENAYKGILREQKINDILS
jgi:hypothetical protein